MADARRNAYEWTIFVIAVAAALAGTPAAWAEWGWTGPSGTLADPTSGTWSTATQWIDSTTMLPGVPPSADDTELTFGGTGTNSYTSTVDAGLGAPPFVLTSLTLNSSSNATNTIAASVGQALRFEGVANVINQNNTGAWDITADVIVPDNGGIELAVLSNAPGNGLVRFTGTLTGAGVLCAQVDSSTVRIAGTTANTLFGLTVCDGVLELAKPAGVNAVSGLLTLTGSTAFVVTQADNQLSGAGIDIVLGTLQLTDHSQSVTGLEAVLEDDPGAPVRIELGSIASTTLTLTGSGTSEYAGLITGAGKLSLTGTGTQSLLSGNTYTGGTTIENGVLVADNASGSATGPGAVTVGTNGRLTGGGTIDPTVGNAVTIGSSAELAPGDLSVRDKTLTVGSLGSENDVIFEADGSYLSKLDTMGGAGLLEVHGSVQLDADSILSLANTGGLSSTYTLVTADAITGTFGTVYFNSILVADPFAVGALGGTHNLLLTGTQVLVVPEPTTLAMLAVAAPLFAGLRRIRRRTLGASPRAT